MSERSRTQSSARNIIFGIGKNIVLMLIAFISRKLFITYIGIEYLGINGLFSNILSLLSMADLGFGTAMSFSFYKPLAENDTRKLSALINFYKGVYRIIAGGIAFIGIMIIPFLDVIINLDKPIPHLVVYYLIFLSNTVVSYLWVYKSSIITADQKNYIVDKLTIFVNVGKMIIQCLAIFIFQNYVIYIVLNVIATIINNIIISCEADKLYPYLKEKYILEENEKKHIFNNLKSVFIYKISGSLLNSIDNIVISMCISTVAVGLYSNYFTVTSSLTSFITILFTSLTASVGNLIVKESAEQRYQVFQLSQRISFWVSGFITVCTFLLIPDFIQLWLGKAFDLGYAMAAAVALNLFFSTSMQPIWIFREATGLYRRTKYIMLIAAAINLVLSVLFSYKLGIPGVIFATILSRIVTYFWYEPKILFKEFFDRKVISYYRDYFFNVLLILCCGGILNRIFAWMFHEVSISNWIAKAVISGVIINIVYCLLNIKNGTVTNIINRIKNMCSK